VKLSHEFSKESDGEKAEKKERKEKKSGTITYYNNLSNKHGYDLVREDDDLQTTMNWLKQMMPEQAGDVVIFVTRQNDESPRLCYDIDNFEELQLINDMKILIGWST